MYIVSSENQKQNLGSILCTTCIYWLDEAPFEVQKCFQEYHKFILPVGKKGQSV